MLQRLPARVRRGAIPAMVRVRRDGWVAVQAAIAAGLGWLIASEVLRHQTPFFAAVAAVVIFGTTRGQEISRALQLVFGVAIGAVLAEALGVLIDIPALTITIVVAAAIFLALLADAGPLFAAQAAVSGIFVVAIPSPGTGPIPQRFFDALVGGGVALVIGHLVFPVHPLSLLADSARPLFRELAGTLEELAAALEAGDRPRAERALHRARALDADVRETYDALDVGYQITRWALPRRGTRPSLEPWSAALRQVDLAVRDTRVLARAVLALLRAGQPAPAEVVAAVRNLAKAVRALAEQLPAPGRRATRQERQEAAREAALQAAGQAVGVFERQRELALAMVVGQVRSTALDLLRGSGMETAAALDALDEVTGPIVPTPPDGRRDRGARSS